MNTDEKQLQRLRMLQSWVDFVFECLTVEAPRGSERYQQLERLIGERGLRDLREQSFALRNRFEILIVEGESRAKTAVPEILPVS